MDNQKCLKIFEVYQDINKIIIVTEFINGGNLGELIKSDLYG